MSSFSIIMAYHNRLTQTLVSLKRFEDLYAQNNKYDFEVIIVDDKSEDHQDLSTYINQFSYKIIYIKILEKDWINPVVPYNLAFTFASKSIFFIQNPEIYHCSDLFDYYIQHCKPYIYYSFPVFSSPSFNHNTQLIDLENNKNNNNNNIYENFVQKIDYKDYDFDYNYYITQYPELRCFDPENAYNHWIHCGIFEKRSCNKHNIFYRKNIIYEWNGWYNHIQYNKRNLHFLTAISKEAFEKIGGFDLDFKDGLWFDDDDLVNRIKNIYHIETIDSNNAFGIHQYHTSGSDDQHLKGDFGSLVAKNRMIMEHNKNNKVVYKENNVLHIVKKFIFLTNEKK